MPTATTAPLARSLRRSQQLMEATRRVHDGLDTRIMAAEPFRDRARYARLLRMQYHFHRDIDTLYLMPLPLPAALDLPARRRLAAVCSDLNDLGEDVPGEGSPAAFGDAPVDPVVAIGWLWVAEGSTLGAASLLRRAAALGLDQSFGARHLAPPADGRGASWKAFTTAVDALALDAAADRTMADAARAAFARVRMFADASFA